MSVLELELEVTDDNKLTFLLEEIDPIMDQMKLAIERELGLGAAAEVASPMIVNEIITQTFGRRENDDISKMPPSELGVFIKELKRLAGSVTRKPRVWCDWYTAQTHSKHVRNSYTSAMKAIR